MLLRFVSQPVLSRNAGFRVTHGAFFLVWLISLGMLIGLLGLPTAIAETLGAGPSDSVRNQVVIRTDIQPDVLEGTLLGAGEALSPFAYAPESHALHRMRPSPKDYQNFVTTHPPERLQPEHLPAPAMLMFSLNPAGTTPALKQYLLKEALRSLQPVLQAPVFQRPVIYRP